MAPPTNRQAVGPYIPATLEFGFESTASAGDLGFRGADAATIAVSLFEAPFNGWVSWISLNAVGGNLATCVFLVQIEGTADADSSFSPGAVAAAYQTYAPSAVPFSAGNSIAVEIDSLGTLRDCVVTLGVVFDVSAI